MKYAIISDIHGNLPALQVVLEDAKNQGCNSILFLGDYYGDFPYPNEVVETIRQLPNAVIIAGNKEGYLRGIEEKAPGSCIDKQFAPLYWNFDVMKPDTKEYLMSLPKQAQFDSERGTSFFLSHIYHDFFQTFHRYQHSSGSYAVRMEGKPFTKADFLRQMQHWLAEDTTLQQELSQKEDGVYLFGHSHLQWHVPLKNKLLINGGSCGHPLDYNTDAPYTIIERCPRHSWHVTACRVPYDTEKLIRDLRASTLYEAAPLWGDIVSCSIKTGREHLAFFFQIAHETAAAFGVSGDPFPNDIWEMAAKRWYQHIGKDALKGL